MPTAKYAVLLCAATFGTQAIAQVVNISAPPAGPAADAPADTVKRHGGYELRLGACGMHYFAQRVPGTVFEISHRWPGPTNKADGHFSIGLQASFFPSTGRWKEQPFDIGTIGAFRVIEGSGVDGTVRFGSVLVQPNQLFLIRREGAPIRLTGGFRVNPITGDIFDFTTYRITDMRTKMAGVNMPLRWYFGQSSGGRPRFYGEVGLGLDLIFTKAEYEVTTRGIAYDQNTSAVTYSESTHLEQQPMRGKVTNNIYFTHGSVGGGVAYGRFSVFTQTRFLFTSTYVRGSRSHKRIRGNIMAMPALAGADTDQDVRDRLVRDGILPFGRTGLSKGSDDDALTATADDANGLSRFWDPQQWIVGLAFKIR